MQTRKWTISVNGHITDPDHAKIPVLDRGFLFGDSVYEVTTTRKGVVMFWEEHFQRLCHSAEGIGMAIENSSDHFLRRVEKTIEASGFSPMEKLYIRLIVTRGSSLDIGLFPRDLSPQNEIILVQKFPPVPESVLKNGLQLMVAENIQRNSRQSTDPNLKTGNYLNSIQALREAKNKGFDDGVMLNAQGYVTEGTTFNIWGVKGGTVITSPLHAGILLGITRKKIFEICQQNQISVREADFSRNELLSMDEVFVSSSGKDVAFVGRINDKTFKQGPVTLKIAGLYSNLADNYCRLKTKPS